ncbi:hypothetical protein DL93DRAFT_2232619 [Clavulina sp. PMI_390]|nr:hypothetical protein DL93DRAFT_2232619 [Clavulina sp. PMI_390]
MLSSDDWEKAVRQSKPPKPRLDVVCVEHVIGVIEKRLAQYPTSLEDDNALLGRSSELPFNRRNAIIVRVGEKRILRQVLETAQESLRELRAEIMASSTSTNNKQKRPRPSLENEGGQKRAKR